RDEQALELRLDRALGGLRGCLSLGPPCRKHFFPNRQIVSLLMAIRRHELDRRAGTHLTMVRASGSGSPLVHVLVSRDGLDHLGSIPHGDRDLLYFALRVPGSASLREFGQAERGDVRI